MDEERRYQSKVIAKLASKKSLMDFSDKLILAYPEDARNLFGCGGKGHAPNSTIGLNITSLESKDYCSFNLEPYVFDQMLEICRKNLGEFCVSGAIKDLIAQQYFDVASIRAALAAVGKEMTEASAETKNTLASIGFQLQKLEQAAISMKKIPVESFVDWSYRDHKVDNYHPLDDGFVPVSDLLITRNQFLISRDGEETERRQPYYWHFEIKNFEAKLSIDERGLTSDIGSTARKVKRVSIDVTDEAVYEACWLVGRFVGVFEVTHCVPNYEAVKKEEERVRRALASETTRKTA